MVGAHDPFSEYCISMQAIKYKVFFQEAGLPLQRAGRIAVVILKWWRVNRISGVLPICIIEGNAKLQLEDGESKHYVLSPFKVMDFLGSVPAVVNGRAL